MKKIILALFIVCAISTIAIVGLYYFTKDNEILSGDFNRRMHEDVLPVVLIYKIEMKYAYIAGTSADTVYISSPSTSTTIDAINIHDGKSRKHKVALTGVIWGRSSIDYPSIFQNNKNHEVIQSNLDGDRVIKRYPLPYFADALPLTHSSFALRTYNNSRTEFVLAKSSPSGTTTFPDYLQKQIDGIFCTDGMMTYNRTKNRLFYVYYYRNEFLSMDSALNLIYRGKTIDSISKVKIRVATGSSNERSIASPARIVNNLIHSSGPLLYINSHVIGLNETRRQHRSGEMIDCYAVESGAYQSSFYLSNYDGQKMIQFSTNERSFIALYKKALIVYEIPKASVILSRNP